MGLRAISCWLAVALLTLTPACSGTAPAAGRATTARAPSAAGGRPQLAVLLVIDQLRGDLLERMRSRFQDGGARRLLDQGTVYTGAHYDHAITETAVGHATLATGALPSVHGIVGNDWYDLARRERTYAVDDDKAPLLDAQGDGKSPRNLLAQTLGDMLVRDSGGRGLVRTVSQKERAAILLAGHGGLAFWLDDKAGTFLTSRYYASATPDWVRAYTAKKPLEAYRNGQWALLSSESSYLAQDDRPWEAGFKHLGTRFPHPLAAENEPDFVRGLRYTPFSDELVLSFAQAMVEHEQLGRDAVPDLLAISLSSTDYVGHVFGPESREAEDNLLRLDRTLARLLAFLDAKVGPEHYVLVLSADHGIGESPEYWASQAQDAGRIDPKALVSTLNQALRASLAIQDDLILDFVVPSLWLDEGRVRELGLDLPTVEKTLAELARRQPGIHAAYAKSDVLRGSVPNDAPSQRVKHSVHPARSGHVYLVPRPHWLLSDAGGGYAAAHGTPWDYDTHVPVVFWGRGIRAQRVGRAIDPRDVAPTLAALLGIEPPPGASGTVLREVVTQ